MQAAKSGILAINGGSSSIKFALSPGVRAGLIMTCFPPVRASKMTT
jgi:hypothetical protein